MITCAKCGKENQDHYKFCLGCGAELPRDAAPKAFSPKTPAHGMKAAAAAPPPAPNFAPPPAAPNFAPPPAAPAAPAPNFAPPPAAPPRPAAAAPAPMPMAPAPNFAPPPQPMAPAPMPQPVAPAPMASPPVTGGWSCPTCGHANNATNKFCASCGTPAAAGASAPPPPQPQASSGGVASKVSLTALRADGSDAGTFQLPEGASIVGRDLGGIFGGDSYLSPKHATFRVSGGRVTVKDEGSLNGVYIKIARDNPTELKPGDIFRIGQEIIRFERLQPPAPSPDGVERLGSPSEGVIGRLVLVTGRETGGNAFVIQAHGIHLGRERGDVVFPEDGYVSGLHCRIAPEAGRVFLTDLGSSNGTYVRFNDEREVRGGDILLMGQQLFRVG